MRSFVQHNIRPVFDLNGAWTWAFPASGTSISTSDWRGQGEVWPVPGVWEQMPARTAYRGEALIGRRLQLPRAGRLRLHFGGVSHSCRVSLDGMEIGGHHNAFTGFTIDLPTVAAGEHELLLHVSNAHGELSGLHIPNDYYNYGGISRGVQAMLLPEASLDLLHATPVRDGDQWHLDCHISCSGKLAGKQVHVSCAGGSWQGPLPEDGELRCRLTCPEAETWWPGRPRLFLVEARLLNGERAIDDLIERVGFRSVRCQGQRILLNEEPVHLLGYNRHEDHPDWGCAIPLSLMRRDLHILRDLGCNTVRTCHYPNDPLFLDCCDEMGFLVWEENHARGQDIDQMQHPRFREQCYAVTREMLEQHHNHPCILLWGIMNECASESEEGRAMYQEQFALIEASDPSRPTTYASCRHDNDICQDLPQVNSWNIYPLWYGDHLPLETVQGLLDRFDQHLRNKPIIISECGAGAIPGVHDHFGRSRW
ncbi:MAG: glycoside hydrolase family 2 protein, partial [Planctomycetota bacterium]